MAEFSLRPATPSDLQALHALDLLCFSEPFRFDLATMKRFAGQAGAITLIAESGGPVLGFVLVHRSRHRAYVTTLDVHPLHRRQGIAQALMAAAELRSAAAGAAWMALHVHTENRHAISFYEASGYTQTSHVEDFYGPGLHAWVYAKALPAASPR